LDKPHNAKQTQKKDVPFTTIWDKYVISQTYAIKYLKFYR